MPRNRRSRRHQQGLELQNVQTPRNQVSLRHYQELVEQIPVVVTVSQILFQDEYGNVVSFYHLRAWVPVAFNRQRRAIRNSELTDQKKAILFFCFIFVIVALVVKAFSEKDRWHY